MILQLIRALAMLMLNAVQIATLLRSCGWAMKTARAASYYR